MNMEHFLRLVLPDEGFYCWVEIRNGKPRQGHVETIEQLADKLRSIDSSGADAYFGCASYLTDDNRRQANVKEIKSFWLDIDCGEEKDAKGEGYETPEDAADAVEGFCSAVGLPGPFLIRSGYGLHCWFPLLSPVLSDEWRAYAANLQKLCDTHGLRVDSSRTSDSASILRAPETHNYKRGGRSEVFIWDSEPDTYMGTDADRVCRILGTASNLPSTGPKILGAGTGPASTVPNGFGGGFDFTRGVGDGFRTSYLTSLAGHCFAIGMSPTQTLEKIQAWNQLNTPPLDDEKVIHHVTGMWNTHKKNHPIIENLPVCPGNYSWKNNRLVVLDDKEDGEIKELIVTTQPVFLTDITRMEYATNLAYIFRQYLPHDGWREFVILASDFESSSWFAHMAKAGADRGCISHPKLFRDFIGLQAQQMRRDNMESLRYEQFGWKNDKIDFLIGDVLINADGTTERVHVSEELYPRVKLLSVPPRASLDTWRSEANKLFSDALLPIGFGLVASFCAPILGLCMNQSDGGIVLHFMSEESGKGKSKLIEASASVWGQLKSTRLTASDTINSQFKIISLNNNIPVQIDELQQVDPQMAVKLIKRFTVGEDKNRLKQTGELVVKENTFQTLMTTTANYSLLEKLRASGDEGAIARVLEIYVNTPDGPELRGLDEITRVMNEHCGVAAREFVSKLVLPGVRNAVKAQYDILKLQYSNTGGAENRYVNRLLAAIHITSALLVHYQILQFEPKRLIDWLVGQCNERKSVTVSNDPVDTISTFLSEFSHECLSVSGRYNPNSPTSFVVHNTVLPRNINLRYEKDKGCMYVPTKMMEVWCNKNKIHFSSLKKRLEEAGILLDTSTPVNLSAYTSINTGRRRCWKILMGHPKLSGLAMDVQQMDDEQEQAI